MNQIYSIYYSNKAFYKIIFICFCCICVFSGCSNVSFIKVEKKRTLLMNDIESYQSVDEFKNYLTHNSIKWDVKVDSHDRARGRPPYDIYTIVVKNYSHLGFSGDLDVVFFNNRLCAVSFQPNNIEQYIEKLKKTDGIIFDNVKYGFKEGKQPPFTRISYGIYDETSKQEKKYIRWSDIRLDNELKIWIGRYS